MTEFRQAVVAADYGMTNSFVCATGRGHILSRVAEKRSKVRSSSTLRLRQADSHSIERETRVKLLSSATHLYPRNLMKPVAKHLHTIYLLLGSVCTNKPHSVQTARQRPSSCSSHAIATLTIKAKAKDSPWRGWLSAGSQHNHRTEHGRTSTSMWRGVHQQVSEGVGHQSRGGQVRTRSRGVSGHLQGCRVHDKLGSTRIVWRGSKPRSAQEKLNPSSRVVGFMTRGGLKI